MQSKELSTINQYIKKSSHGIKVDINLVGAPSNFRASSILVINYQIKDEISL